MSTATIDIEELQNAMEDLIGLMEFGHVDFDAFLEACERYLTEAYGANHSITIKRATIRHQFYRAIERGEITEYHLVKRITPTALSVTVVDAE